ncbi:hypothetical protein ACFL2V_15920 [Pseudomonadota bacterium]
MAELPILVLNAIIIGIAYFVVYPKLAGGNESKIMLNDVFASGVALLIAGFMYWDSGQKFSLLFTDVNWFWFTLATFMVLEAPITIWYYEKNNVHKDKDEYVMFNGFEVISWWPEYVGKCQNETVYSIEGEVYSRIRFGQGGNDTYYDESPCPGCAVMKGQLHAIGCDSEPCPKCRNQLVDCHCVYDDRDE